MATLGKTDAGTNTQSVSADRFWFCGSVVAPEAGTIDSIHFLANISNDVQTALARGAVYKFSDGSRIALGGEVTVSGSVLTWYTSTAAGEAFANGDILLICFHHADPGTQNLVVSRDNTTAAAGFVADTYADGTPATFPAVTDNNGPLAAYITYTPAGGGGSNMPVVMHHLREQGVS